MACEDEGEVDWGFRARFVVNGMQGSSGVGWDCDFVADTAACAATVDGEGVVWERHDAFGGPKVNYTLENITSRRGD